MLSSGQVDAVTQNLNDRTLARFADTETDLVSTLADLSVADTAVVMRRWRDLATHDDDGPVPERSRELHLSALLDGRWRLDGNLDAETGELVATALRLAATGEVEGEPVRSPGERRADGLGDICRFFLDHQHTHPGGRHRPHLNLIVRADPTGGSTGETPAGTVFDPATVRRLLCDSALHRVVTAGSAVLDYGRSTRTVPTPLWQALVIRDRHCRFPGCDRPSHWCEAHHVRPWERGGATNQQNLVVLGCRHHHLLHQPGWHTKLHPDGTLDVTHPDGHTRTTTPPTLDPAHPPRPG